MKKKLPGVHKRERNLMQHIFLHAYIFKVFSALLVFALAEHVVREIMFCLFVTNAFWYFLICQNIFVMNLITEKKIVQIECKTSFSIIFKFPIIKSFPS